MTPTAIGIDAGAAFTRVLVLGLDEAGPCYYSHGAVKSEGWRKGSIYNYAEATECIHQALALARQDEPLPLHRVVFGYGSKGIPDSTPIAELVRLLDFEAIEYLFEPEAASRVALSTKDRDEGAILVDIGAQSSAVAVWFEGEMQFACGLPIGGDHFTNDVATCLRIPVEDAAELTERHGWVSNVSDDDVKIVMPAKGRRPVREISSQLLRQVLEARATEVGAYLDHTLRRQGVDPDFPGDLLVSGGGAHLRGIHDSLHTSLQRPVRTAMPGGISGMPDELLDPSWSVAAGLAVEGAWRAVF